MKTVEDYNFSGQKALVRVDFNVPLDDNQKITDDSRIVAVLPTLFKILYDGGSVILMSHLGRPKEGREEKFSLIHLVDHLSELLGTKVKFCEDCKGGEVQDIATSLKAGEVLLLENVRFYKGENKGDEHFAKELAKLGDVYVNDAFGTAHRAHASTTIVALYFPAEKKMFGLLMAKEIENAERGLNSDERPFTAIVGGAKVSDKILVIENLLDKLDNLLIGGGMTYTFYKSLGGEVGKSLVEEKKLAVARSIIKKAKENKVNLVLPPDSLAGSHFSAEAQTAVHDNMHIPDDWIGLDIGPQAIEKYRSIILKSKKILWNGAVGVYEMAPFANGTKIIGEAIAEATRNGCYSLIGGGDTVAALKKFDLYDKVTFASTGGGALLQYFEGKELPGIRAITG